LVICDEKKKPLAEVSLAPEENGYFAGLVAEAVPGTLYGFRVERQMEIFADPASRFQPLGPEGPSQVFDVKRFAWTDSAWQGVQRDGQVLYEMHIGTFTAEGTYAAAAKQLRELAELGVTVIEMMPLADFSGPFGWGYDGVCMFAPTRLYGTPDDLCRFIDHAHSVGLGVILDVVYNHFGPVGQHMEQFSDYYFSQQHGTDWGKGINYYGPESAEVRNFFITNAAYWIEDFHFDGLRLDATQDIHDKSADHVLAAIARQVRISGGKRATFLVAENEPQDTRIVRAPSLRASGSEVVREKGVEQVRTTPRRLTTSPPHNLSSGFGLDALWNDDFHHTAEVLLTGRHEAYFTDYRGTPQEFVSIAKYGYLFQGQWYAWQQKRRGSPTFDLPPSAMINYLQNHDQIANSIRGARVHETSHPGCYRAMTAFLLLGPATPLLFQGQEFASSSPFWFFADTAVDLRESYRKGRLEFLSQFPSIAPPASQKCSPNPSDRKTFERCKLDFSERQTHAEAYALHRDLLRIRRDDPTIHRQRAHGLDGAVLGMQAFVLRIFGEEQDDRLLLFNLGVDLSLSPAPEPLLAPPEDCRWQLMWSSEDPIYGGNGTPSIEADGNWSIPGYSAIVMKPEVRL
jgi:maltooligosyltrehalose trehalohydrolase